jgi:hypothetical protein
VTIGIILLARVTLAQRCTMPAVARRRGVDNQRWMAIFEDGEGNTLALMHEKR